MNNDTEKTIEFGEGLANFLDRSIKAITLLEKVYFEIDVYSGVPHNTIKIDKKEHNAISSDLLFKLRDFFSFDDSM